MRLCHSIPESLKIAVAIRIYKINQIFAAFPTLTFEKWLPVTFFETKLKWENCNKNFVNICQKLFFEGVPRPGKGFSDFDCLIDF